jgi:predicted ester cyclase
MWDTIRNQDLEELRALYHPDYTHTGTDGQERKGADAGIAIAQTYTSAFPDMSFEFRHKYAYGDDVSIIELAFRGTHQGELEGISPTGRQVEGVACNVIEVRDGKIYRERDYFDNLAILSQLDVSPQAGK